MASLMLVLLALTWLSCPRALASWLPLKNSPNEVLVSLLKDVKENSEDTHFSEASYRPNSAIFMAAPGFPAISTNCLNAVLPLILPFMSGKIDPIALLTSPLGACKSFLLC